MRRSPRLSALVLTVVTVGAVLLPAGTASAAVTYAGTLAGPSIAATYPSGLEYDDVNGRLVVADTGLDRIEFYTYNVSAGTYLKTGQFGSHGTGDGQFDSPRDVAIDDVGNIYVGDAANNRVQSFTSGGAFRWQKGGTGSCNDCLNTPIGVTWDAQNDVLLVASTGQDLIKAFDSAGTYQWRSPTAATIGIDAPRDVARGPDGRIWIADYAHHQVKAFNVSANGATWTNTPEIVLGDGVAGGGGNGQVNFPYNMDFSLDGQTVYVSDTGNNRVVRWDLSTPTPTWLGPAIGGDCPQSPNPCLDPPADFGTIDTLRRVVVDPAGRLVTADFWGNGMQVFDGTTGSMLLQMELASAPAPGFAQAFGVATGSTGLVYAVDRLNQRLEHFNAAGGFIRAAGSRGTANGRFSWPEAVAVDPVSGVVWAADTRGDRIQRWAAGITPLSTQSEGTSGTGVGQFNYIEDLDVAPDGDVYVADTRNDRIQIYDPPTDSFSVFPAAPTGGAMNDPQGVVATATSVFVADTGTNRILKFSRTSGAQQAVFSTGLAGPQGIAVDDADGTVWVADTGNNRILHLSADLADLGHTFGSAGTGNLQFDLPHTLDVSGDRLYVTDTFNDRITYFDISSLGGGGPDTTPPTTIVAVPANAQVFTALPVAMSGTASDNVGVQKVEVGIQDRVSKLWYRSNATWGAYQKQLATLASPNAASTGWTYTWTPPAGGSNQYGVSVIATDTSNVVATAKPWRTFDVNISGGGGGLTATYDSQVTAAGGVAPLYPAGAAAAADGTRYVADSGGSRVVTISSGGVQTELSPASAGWNDPRDIDIDVEVPSELWVADTGDSQIIRLGTNGQVLATFGGTTVLNQPYGLANDASGVYVADTYNNRVVKLNESTGAVLWSVTTCGGNTLQRPRDVAVGSNGDIYVADTDRNRIVRLTAAGACVSAFGASGTGNGQYRAPRSLTSDGAGGLWITEGTGARLQHVSNTGTYIAKIGAFGEATGQFRSAHCVFMDGAFVAVCDTFNYRIQRFSVSGAGVPTFSSVLGGIRPTNGGFNGAFDVAYGPDGSIYATDWFNHRIEKFDANGVFVAAWGGYGTANGSFIFPRGIAVKSDGTVVVTDSENNRIDLLTSAGAFVGSVKPAAGQTPFLRPHQAAVANNNSYWVADTGNNRIVRVDAAGAVLQNWNNGATIRGPRGIAVDENGDVYVANSGNNRIEKYNPSGTRLAVLANNGTGQGQVKNPYGLRIVGTGANALLLVADRGNGRIVVLKLDGTFVTSFGAVGTGNGQFTQPQGVAQNPLNGDLAVADFGNNRLSVWTTT